MVGGFTPLVVKAVKHETDEAVSIQFAYPEENKASFPYQPGQSITIRWHENGKEYRRSYSICSIPEDPDIMIMVKEVTGGKISPILNRDLKPGDVLEVIPPEGRFTAEFNIDKKRKLFLIGAGSGITPLLSLLRTALEKEPKSTVILLYGSRTEDKIIFRTQLDELADRYQGQLFIYYTLSKPERSGSGLMGSLFNRKKPEWTGWKGRISSEQIEKILALHPGQRQQDLFFVCGPGDLIQMTEKTLRAAGISEEAIKKEYFTPPSQDHPTQQNEINPRIKGEPSQVIVHLRGERIEATVTNKTILDTLLDLGWDAPYSCHAGACATCMAKVLQGKVEMDACYALNDREVESGYILSCQSHPTTGFVEITYDE
jgi:ring-1,2-phenylacetyl-CoA epoxidase subunit PaaE